MTKDELIEENKKLKTQLRWSLKQMRNLGMSEDLEKRYSKAEKLVKRKNEIRHK